jgi:hypothetical protein
MERKEIDEGREEICAMREERDGEGLEDADLC